MDHNESEWKKLQVSFRGKWNSELAHYSDVKMCHKDALLEKGKNRIHANNVLSSY